MDNFSAPQSTELNSSPATPPQPKPLFYLILVFLLLLVGLGGFVLGKYFTETKEEPINTTIPVVKKPVSLPSTDPTVGWKTYENNKYGFSLKYPPELIIDLKNIGFISGSDYYGTRDFNFLINNPKIEPSHQGIISDATGKHVWQFDGYNFAIFSGESATKHLSNDLDIIKIGNQFSPPLEKEMVNILGQEYPLYFIPPTKLPNTDKTSFWFTSFPCGNSTVIVTGNYDKITLHQILSTFRFLDTTQATGTENWKIYENKEVGFSFKYPVDLTFENNTQDKRQLGIKIKNLDNYIDEPQGYDKKTALDDEKFLAMGEYGMKIGMSYQPSEKVITINNKYAKTFDVFQGLDICSVIFSRNILLYFNNYQIQINLSAPKEKIIAESPDYFTFNYENCGNSPIWLYLDTFYSELKLNKLDKRSKYAQNWYNTFDQILSTFKFIE